MVVPMHRDRGHDRIGPVLIDRHTVAMADRPGRLRHHHLAKDCPTFGKYRPIILLNKGSVWIMLKHHSHDYMPAAGHDAFLPGYDLLTRLFGFNRVHHN